MMHNMAALTAAVGGRPEARDQRLILTGARPITWHELVEMTAQQLGRPSEFFDMPLDTARPRRRSASA
jgi:hypothetical protein